MVVREARLADGYTEQEWENEQAKVEDEIDRAFYEAHEAEERAINWHKRRLAIENHRPHEYLKSERIRLGYSTKEFATFMGVPLRTYQNYEAAVISESARIKGKRPSIPTDALRNLSKHVDIDFNVLITGSPKLSSELGVASLIRLESKISLEIEKFIENRINEVSDEREIPFSVLEKNRHRYEWKNEILPRKERERLINLFKDILHDDFSFNEANTQARLIDIIDEFVNARLYEVTLDDGELEA